MAFGEEHKQDVQALGQGCICSLLAGASQGA